MSKICGCAPALVTHNGEMGNSSPTLARLNVFRRRENHVVLPPTARVFHNSPYLLASILVNYSNASCESFQRIDCIT